MFFLYFFMFLHVFQLKTFCRFWEKTQKTTCMSPTWSSEICVKLCGVAVWSGTINGLWGPAFLYPRGWSSLGCLGVLQSMITLSFLICEMGLSALPVNQSRCEDQMRSWRGMECPLEIMNCIYCCGVSTTELYRVSIEKKKK